MMIRPLILIYLLVLTTEKYCVLSNAEPRRRQGIFSSPYPSRPTLGPTSYLYNGHCGSFPGVKRPGRRGRGAAFTHTLNSYMNFRVLQSAHEKTEFHFLHICRLQSVATVPPYLATSAFTMYGHSPA